MFNASAMVEAETSIVRTQAVAEVLDLLVKFIYGKEIHVPVPLAMDLYQLADQYQVQSALDSLCYIMFEREDELCPEALAQILHKAYQLNGAAQQVLDLAKRAIAPHLAAAAQTEWFAQWDIELLQQVVAHGCTPDSDTQPSGVTRLVAAATWVYAAQDSRLQYMETLLDRLQIAAIGVTDFQTIQQQHAWVLDIPGVSRTLLAASVQRYSELEQQQQQ